MNIIDVQKNNVTVLPVGDVLQYRLLPCRRSAETCAIYFLKVCRQCRFLKIGGVPNRKFGTLKLL